MVFKKYSIMEHYFYPMVALTTILVLIALISHGKVSKDGILAGKETIKQVQNKDEASGLAIDPSAAQRLLRPSNQPLVAPRYQFRNNGEGMPKKFDKPLEVAMSFFNILSEAANLDGFNTSYKVVGWAKAPYPYAYEMLSPEMKKVLSHQQFLNLFSGIGRINLLKINEMNKVVIKNRIYPRFFVELEAIESSKDKNISYFGYYYGEIIIQDEKSEGWKIRQLNLKGEDFLYHAYFEWKKDAQMIAKTKYQINIIRNINDNGTTKEIYGQAKDGKEYKLTFVKLTDGYDYLIKCLVENGKGNWEEVGI